MAIARALPDDDIYRLEIETQIKDKVAPDIEVFTQYPDIPVMCVQAKHEHTHGLVRLDEFIAKGDESRLLHLYRETQMMYGIRKPVAMFIRLSQPKRLNVVMHTLQSHRTCDDPEVLHSDLFERGWVYMESRVTFCRLLAGIGRWAAERIPRIVPIDWEDARDLRAVQAESRYCRATELVRSWKRTRHSSRMFRDLTDDEFVSKVMEMQMARRIERGDWS
jgi:hypothetical protein